MHSRPKRAHTCVVGEKSPKPTDVSVMAHMYKASPTDQPSIGASTMPMSAASSSGPKAFKYLDDVAHAEYEEC